QRDAGRPRRLALVAGLTSVSLLAAGVVLQSSLTDRKLGAHIANSAPRSLASLMASATLLNKPPENSATRHHQRLKRQGDLAILSCSELITSSALRSEEHTS